MDALREHTRGQTATQWSRRESVLAVATAGILVFLLQAFAVGAFTVSSASMSPTLLPGDFVLVNRLAYRLHPPRRGDIIVFRFPQADGREFAKRVVGLPGDVVGEQDGRLYVNGALWTQAQAINSADDLTSARSQAPRRVAAGRFYVLGDNPDSSLDSRFWGTVDEREVIGKAFLVCWSRGEHWWEVRWNRIGRWLP